MQEDTQGVSGLDELARQDAERARKAEQAKQHTRARHGHKGSRVWGYQVSGGKRRRD
jgi:hypothetical protein